MVRKRKRRRQEEDDVGFHETQPAAPPQDARLTPVDVQQKVFRLAFRGYNERDVDEFLDQITETLASLHEDNKRLREAVQEGGGRPAATEDAERQAAGIVRQAREHAARLIEDAERRAGTSGGDASSAEPAPASFLAKERDFLQRLASLIQDHATSLKDEARRSRDVSPERTEEPPVGQPAEERPTPAGPVAGPPAEPTPPPSPPQKRGAGEEAAGAVPPPPPPFAGPPVIEPAAPQSPSPERGPEPSPPPQVSAPSEERPSEGTFGPVRDEDEATLPWNPEGAAWPTEGARENDPLLSAWESTFLSGQDAEAATADETTADEGETPSLEPGATPAEEEERGRTEEEPSLRELFWGEE